MGNTLTPDTVAFGNQINRETRTPKQPHGEESITIQAPSFYQHSCRLKIEAHNGWQYGAHQMLATRGLLLREMIVKKEIGKSGTMARRGFGRIS